MTTSFATSTLARFWYLHAKTVLGWISSCKLLLPARPLTLQKRNIQTEISRKVLNALCFFLNPKGNMEANLAATVTKVPKVEVEVQIIDLKEVYDKKTKKTLEGLEYRLDDSEVTVVVQASETITSVRAFTQRCPEAAMRTHDTIGSYLFLHSYKRFSMGW